MSNLTTSEHLHPYLIDVAYSTNLVTPNYVSITDIIDVTAGGEEIGESEDTQLQSASATKESGPGWITTNEIEITTYALGTQDRTLAGLYRTKMLLKITNPKLSTQSVAGDTAVATVWLKSRKPQKVGVDSDDRLKMVYTFKISGPVTYAAGS